MSVRFFRRALRIASVAAVASAAPVPAGAQERITALGRLEPRDGVLRLAGPSRPAVVIAELRVGEGDRVEAGQTIAVLDSYELHKALVARLRAELDHAELELERLQRLAGRSAASKAEVERGEIAVRVAQAELAAARAELAMSSVKAPFAGRVLEVHARPGERLGPDGIVELGRTDEMYAVAEVYETDVRRVRVEQRARVTSPALETPIEGTVARVGVKVGKLDLIDADPIAKTDARVVEVRIRLEDSQAVADLTNLQVDVEIFP